MVSAGELVAAASVWIRLSAESVSVLLVGIGIAATLYNLYPALRRPEMMYYNRARLAFSRYLVLALEFLLAGDIVSTAVRPSWDDLGRLAVIATIRTFLNYFLQKEMKEEEREVSHAGESAR